MAEETTMSSQEEDMLLAERVKLGDQDAFRKLFNKHYDWVYSKVYLILLSKQDAEDVSQEIFLKVWLKTDKWSPNHGTFQAWLNRVAKNTSIDAIRKRKRILEVILSSEDDSDMPLIEEFKDTAQTPDRVAIANEAREILENALQKVTKKNHRVAWILRNLEGCSIAEVSKVLQRKEGTVKIWIFRCTKELRKILVRQGINYTPAPLEPTLGG